MVQKCAVLLCINNAGMPGVSFHPFPKDKNLHKQWLIKIGHDDRKCAKVSESMRVCFDHFRESDFKFAVGGCNRFLNKMAIPSLFKFTSPRKVKTPRRQLNRVVSSPTTLVQRSQEVIQTCFKTSKSM